MYLILIEFSDIFQIIPYQYKVCSLDRRMKIYFLFILSLYRNSLFSFSLSVSYTHCVYILATHMRACATFKHRVSPFSSAAKNNPLLLVRASRIFHVYGEIKRGRCETSRRVHVRSHLQPKILPTVSRRVTQTARIFINTPTPRRVPSCRACFAFFSSPGPHGLRAWRSKIRMLHFPRPYLRSITALVECSIRIPPTNCSE